MAFPGVHWLASLSLFLLFNASALALEAKQQPLVDSPKKPNIVFILTDDQDLHMDSLSYMPYLKKHITDRGLAFHNHYCTVALCCPSRVSLWTGKAAHNTNVTDVNPPHGGYPKFISQGLNGKYLPIWLQDAGYSTYYIGKLFNAQTVDNYDSPHAAGWTASDFLLDPFTYRYLNATFQRNHDKPVSYEGQYSTDVLARKTYGFLEDALSERSNSGTPFFLTTAPVAPHSDVYIKQKVIHGNFSEHTSIQSPPIPAERHKHLFPDVKVPRTPHFNPDKPGGASWIARLPKQNETNVEFNDHFYRSRLRALQAVDEMIDGIVKRLEDAGVLDNTYVFFSTDNGYHVGQHRLQPGKQCAFEEDINIPLMVRGPGVPQGMTTNIVTSHTDLAPTFMSLAGIAPPSYVTFDGQAIPLTTEGSALAPHPSSAITDGSWRQEHVNVEMWGIIMSEGNYGSTLYQNHTYKALRVVGQHYNLLYTVWCSGEHELYDLNTDPYELENLLSGNGSEQFEFGQTMQNESGTANYSTLFAQNPSAAETSYTISNDSIDDDGPSILRHLTHRLDSLLMVLKTCIGRQCTHPWESLHPAKDVTSLREALNPKYDEFYERNYKEAKVEFTKCEKGYIAESEGKMWNGKRMFGMVDEMAFW